MERLSIQGRLSLCITFVAWVLLTLFIVLNESRYPGTDVFLFKEAGVNLANKGQLVAANLNYMPLDQEMAFAIYPPVYPTAFGLWSRMIGVGLKESLLFECLLRGLRALLLGVMLWGAIKAKFNDSSRWGWGSAYLLFLFLVSQISTDNDRPDELGLIFGLLCFWRLQTAKSGWGLLTAGILLGITGATSPACAICFGLASLCFLLAGERHLARLFGFGLGALVGLSSCILPLVLASPELIGRFLASANRSSNPHSIPYTNKNEWHHFFDRAQYLYERYFFTGPKYVFCAFTLIALALILRKYWKGGAQKAFFNGFMGFVPFAILCWALQPYYLWFASIPLALMLGRVILAIQNKKTALYASLALVVAFVPLFFQEAKGFYFALHRPEAETLTQIRSQLLGYILPNERVAITADQFFTLRNYREVADINFVCLGLANYDFVYATRLSNSRKGQDPNVAIPCWNEKAVKCFEPIENLARPVSLTVAGLETGYMSRGNGGTLYKNTRCPRTIVATKK